MTGMHVGGVGGVSYLLCKMAFSFQSLKIMYGNFQKKRRKKGEDRWWGWYLNTKLNETKSGGAYSFEPSQSLKQY